MFCSGMRENREDVITIPDIEETTFRLILEFLYCGQVEISAENVVSLITAAELFQISDLKAQLYSSFREVANEANIIQLLLVADSYREQKLKTLCKEYILSHYRTIVKTDDFKSLITAENRDLIVEIMNELSPPSKTTKKRKISHKGNKE